MKYPPIRKRVLAGTVVVALILLGVASKGWTFFSQRNQNQKERLLGMLLEQSGTRRQLDLMPAQLEPLLTQWRFRIQRDYYAQLVTLSADAYQPSLVEPAFAKALLEGLEPGEMQALLGWYSSALGKKISARELAASTPEGMRKLNEYFKIITRVPPSSTRLEMILQLDELALGTKTAFEINRGVAGGILQGISSITPREGHALEDSYAKDTKNLKPSLEDRLHAYVIGYYLFAYEELSEREMRAYLGFLNSPPAKKYLKLSSQAMKAAIETSSQNIGKAIAVSKKLRSSAT